MESIQKALKDKGMQTPKKVAVGECLNCRNGTLPNGQPEPKRQLIKLIYPDGTEKDVPCICKNERIVNEKQREINAKTFEQGSLLYGDYKSKSFDTYETETQAQKDALAAAEHFAKHFEDHLKNGQNIFFQGKPGTGKTHLAAAIRKSVRDQNYKVLFLSLPDYIDKIKEEFDSNAKRNPIAKMAKDADLLILDDVGANRMTDFEVSELFKLVDARRGKCTIYTTNYTRNEFFKIPGLHRIFSRMLDNAKAIVLNGKDYRTGGLF